jgi:hypothetical protein
MTRITLASLLVVVLASGMTWAQADKPALPEAIVPTGGANIDANFARIVAHEATDGAFTIAIKGGIAAPGVPLQVFAPGGASVLQTTVPEGSGQSYTIDADGKVGDYVILIKLRDLPGEFVAAPVTSLPQEVYVMGYWSQRKAMRYFTRIANGPDGKVVVQPHRLTGSILTRDGATTLATTTKGDMLEAVMPEDGAWIDIKAVYVNMPKGTRLVLSLDPDRFFTPTSEALGQKPTP